MNLSPQPGILDIAPYQGGRSTVEGVERVFKLSSNESPLGPSPRAIEAFCSAASDLALYPEGSSIELREKLGDKYGIDPARIVCGAGSDELIHLLAQAYLGPGDEAIFSEHGFAIYRIATQAAGATPVSVPEPQLKADVDLILRAVTDRTRVVFLANPNNPTGTYLTQAELKRLRMELRPDVLLLVDAAYAEYVRRNDYESGFELVATNDNVVMSRTFSKVHGLASARVGWVYCPAAVADVLNRVRGPFNVSGPAIAAAAASLDDQAHIDRAVRHNDEWLSWLAHELSAVGIGVAESATNFLLLRLPDTPGKTAADADPFLVKQGLILRRLESYGLPEYLRASVGTEEANRALVDALSEFMKGATRV